MENRAPNPQSQAKGPEEVLAMAATPGQNGALGQLTLWIPQAPSLPLMLTAAAVGQGWVWSPWSPPLCPAALGWPKSRRNRPESLS